MATFVGTGQVGGCRPVVIYSAENNYPSAQEENVTFSPPREMEAQNDQLTHLLKIIQLVK